MLKLNKTNESGRSMVEMLGVLAIVGVLSVMGIVGYSIAMTTHRANETLSQAVRYATIISAQRQLNGGVGKPTEDRNGPYTFTLVNNENNIVMTVQVPDAVKTKLVNMDVSGVHISENGSSVVFTFNNDMSKLSEDQKVCAGKDAGSSCGGIKTCQSGTCQVNYDEWYQGDCPSGKVTVKIVGFNDASTTYGCAEKQEEASGLCPTGSLGPGVSGTGEASIENMPDGGKKWFVCGTTSGGLYYF